MVIKRERFFIKKGSFTIRSKRVVQISAMTANVFVWSSSENSNNRSWVLYMGNGYRSASGKFNHLLRAMFPALLIKNYEI